ncbi:MAG: hypothetical protein COT39_01575 [Parcubacteria group bacterium CG08_land_8_20_14_0_20_48_21]|nr:MAG: hypothetical protein AUK21_03525 [Parcubacteria group bacterium CG2_30_48_51]PIS33004.1 MAG: hypothetical protein COT39_01575 [Parcubacteria group bacterium CG08_land_8_20_14_0_20_48_21]PIW79547.1 MAG: hypothetical protein COZ99_00400 [Parcubacteria group bacterium CG_4_8_14_3_um_filter_48_16]PIY77630.1 MAG: hypothetical protein COY83_04160 [Parcubacteria group bacterium CG_4_10_14_0_8_um_filter_48_154]PIZ77242.1 MAG: hypothetical protein COY03_03475 [bacterium CG_4_10_14_0_2_um_filter_
MFVSVNQKNTNNLADLPQKPGVYVLRGARKTILYVGKASRLRNRVRSYFQKTSTYVSPVKFNLVPEIRSVEIRETGSEIEALLLEANLIKKYQPPYNVLLRDDKSYIYIKIATEELFPRIFTTRTLEKAGTYYGPFTSADAVKEVLKLVRKFFPYRDSSCKPDQGFPCFSYRLGRCPGPCVGAITQLEYRKIIRKIKLFFEGKHSELAREVKRELREERKRLQSETDEGKRGALELAIARKEVQAENLREVIVHTKLVTSQEKFAYDVRELARALHLPAMPHRIEGYDIAHTGGLNATGSLVVFAEGEPLKSAYRKFRMKTVAEKPNDTAMLKEVLSRRLTKLDTTEAARWKLPDLMVIDGGKAQLNAARSALRSGGVSVPVVAIAKGGIHGSQLRQKDELYFPGEKKPLVLPKNSPALHIIQRVRDEAHRFALSYHQHLRSKRMVQR